MKKRVDKVVKDIKSVKIQGARNIAKAALEVYSKDKTKSTKNKLINARPTEPMLVNTLHNFEKLGLKKTVKHFDYAQDKINKLVIKLIKNNFVIFTHCHSTNVVQALVYAKKISGKKFEVYNTETRPLYQGRKTARELKRAGIKVTMFSDSSIGLALNNQQKTKKVDIVFLGADAILKDGIINKIGSGMIAELAKADKIPVYIIADSWKYSKTKVKIEERNVNEIWGKAPKNIKIRNPAFEKVQAKYIKAIVSELGILPLKKFVKKST